jgi:hypothetical protein
MDEKLFKRLIESATDAANTAASAAAEASLRTKTMRKELAELRHAVAENTRSISNISPESLAMRVPRSTIEGALAALKRAEESGAPIRPKRDTDFPGIWVGDNRFGFKVSYAKLVQVAVLAIGLAIGYGAALVHAFVAYYKSQPPASAPAQGRELK